MCLDRVRTKEVLGRQRKLFTVSIFSEQHLRLRMSSRKTAGRRGTTKKRAQRATSNVFAMFNQDQIQEFKEAFNMIDHNR